MTAISHEWVTLGAGDGTELDAYVASPVGGEAKHAGVIVLQEIWGVNAHIRDVTDRFARLGYLAVAPDVFHRTAPRFEAAYDQTTGLEHAKKMTREGATADTHAVYEWMREKLSASTDDPRVGACGFCLGGRLSFVANAQLPLACAVSFYGGGIAQNLELAPAQHGPLLMFWGGKDNHITKDHRRATADALEAAQKRFTEVNVGHAQHGFFCDQRPSYDSEAAREAWGLVTNFFASNLDAE
jgi:carboxymethylenebutenolidase